MNDYVVAREARRAELAEVEMTAKQKEQLEHVLAWSVFHQPFFAHLLLSQLPIRAVADVPVAATDGYVIMINPDTFFNYSISEQAFILYHEVLHGVFHDPAILQGWAALGKVRVGSKDIDFNWRAFQHAADYVINANLINGQCGSAPANVLYDKKYSAKGEEAMVDVYEKVLKDLPPNSQNDQTDGFDMVKTPAETSPDPNNPKKPRDPSSMQEAVAAAAQAAEAQGKLPAGFKRLIGEILDPKVPWQDHLRATMLRVHGSDGLDWEKADHRMLSRSQVGHEPIFFGRPTGFGAGTIVVAVDTSGSIGDAQIAAFFGEMRGIIEDINPKELIVMWCDAKVQRVDTVEELSDLEELRCKGAPGGGGTSFVPVFRKVERQGIEPDMLVYLTDMFGEFPNEAPAYPVIWGSISRIKEAPFGEVVEIEI